MIALRIGDPAGHGRDHIEIHGETTEIAADFTFAARSIYTAMAQTDKQQADIFKTVVGTLLAKDSAAWDTPTQQATIDGRELRHK